MNVLLVPDGNRRWAKNHQLTYDDGYHKCVQNLGKTIEWLDAQGIAEVWIGVCTIKNLYRPADQVQASLTRFLELPKATRLPLDFTVSSGVDLLPGAFPAQYRKLAKPHQDRRFTVHYLLGWSLDAEVARLVNQFRGGETQVGRGALLEASDISKPIDLIIRAGRVSRLSGMIPWHSPYAEVYLLEKFWPDVTTEDLDKAFAFYEEQERRAGL